GGVDLQVGGRGDVLSCGAAYNPGDTVLVRIFPGFVLGQNRQGKTRMKSDLPVPHAACVVDLCSFAFNSAAEFQEGSTFRLRTPNDGCMTDWAALACACKPIDVRNQIGRPKRHALSSGSRLHSLLTPAPFPR